MMFLHANSGIAEHLLLVFMMCGRSYCLLNDILIQPFAAKYAWI